MADSIVTGVIDTSSITDNLSVDFTTKDTMLLDTADRDSLWFFSETVSPIRSTTVSDTPPSHYINPTLTNQAELPKPSDDWYNRIHLIPSETELGNLLTAQVVDIEVWNGFFTPQNLTSITESGTTGITLMEPDPTPLIFGPLESKAYAVGISSVGPATIEGVYYFNFDVYTVIFSVFGNRVVVWPFPPQAEFSEVVEFKTDIIKTKSGEQRIALRTTPRVSYQGAFLLDENKFSQLKALMSQWGARKFAFPVWPEFAYVGVVSNGTTTINVDTTQSSYEVGSAIILYQRHDLYEAGEVESMTDTSITLVIPVAGDFTQALVMPTAFMNLDEGISVSRGANKVPVGQTKFSSSGSVNIEADTGKVQLRDKDVYLTRNAVISSVSEKLFTDVDLIDNSVGIKVIVPKRNFGEHEQVLSFDCQTKSLIWEVKQWLYSLKGQQKSFFIPSWNMDLSLLAPLTTASTTLLVRSIGYALYYTEKDVLIRLKDGTELLRRAIAGVDAGASTESIVLDSQIGQDIALDDIDIICFVSHVRLAADRFEISYLSGGGATISIPIREIPE